MKNNNPIKLKNRKIHIIELSIIFTIYFFRYVIDKRNRGAALGLTTPPSLSASFENNQSFPRLATRKRKEKEGSPRLDRQVENFDRESADDVTDRQVRFFCSFQSINNKLFYRNHVGWFLSMQSLKQKFDSNINHKVYKTQFFWVDEKPFTFVFPL